MTVSKERIKRYTAEELESLRRGGKAGSDWRRAAKEPLPDGSDPDDALEPVNLDWVSTELPMPKRKAHASLRIDAEVLEWFRAQGRGYQTRITRSCGAITNSIAVGKAFSSSDHLWPRQKT
jgi:uncharacterized protein (DUF4415 family)